MEITWLGHSCFRLRGRDVSIVVDPPDRSTGYSLPKLSADVVLVSHDHPGHNNAAAVGGGPKVLTGPGEYEIKGVPIVGVQTSHDGEGGRRRGQNVAWIAQVDDVNVCHLGDVGSTLTTEQAEALGNVDVLLVPVGGHNTINAAQAAEVVTLLEPKVVIPMHYQTEARRGDAKLDGVDVFLREQGAGDVQPQPKLTLTKASLPDDTQVVLLDYKRAS
jgi:L-ascorbate metabolism protein UlaG (beta-lactamase superfamily)